MKKTVLIILLGILSLTTYGQDIIIKKNNDTIVAMVSEISTITITYKRFDQQDGPNRKLPLYEVKSITYKNGYVEKFNVEETISNQIVSAPEYIPGSINNTGRTIIIPRPGPDIRVKPGEQFPGGSKMKKSQERVGNNGSYFEAMIGYAQLSRRNNNYYYGYYNNSTSLSDNVTIGARFGHKFYFGGDDDIWKFGINCNWVQLNMITDNMRPEYITFLPLNVGLAGVYRFSRTAGIELNTTTGLVLSSYMRSNYGYRLGADLKYVYKSFAIGADASRIMSFEKNTDEFTNMFTLTIGAKF